MNNRVGVIEAAAVPRLRFDKVVVRIIARLQAAAREIVPDGTTILLTISAPIRLPAKTAAALESRLAEPRWEGTIHDNRIRLRRVHSRSPARLAVFVHNQDADPAALLDLAQSLLAAAVPGRRLTIAVKDGSTPVETYRQLCSQLAITGFATIQLVHPTGLIEL